MAAYTITTTAAQEALLSFVVSVYNREHDTALTSDEFVHARFASLLEPYAAVYRAAVAKNVQTTFAAATPDVQQQVKDLLNIT
jgi:hypothetical protein